MGESGGLRGGEFGVDNLKTVIISSEPKTVIDYVKHLILLVLTAEYPLDRHFKPKFEKFKSIFKRMLSRKLI